MKGEGQLQLPLRLLNKPMQLHVISPYTVIANKEECKQARIRTVELSLSNTKFKKMTIKVC